MRIAFLCKRRYMSKDVILDRYARLYEIPHQLARMGHDVLGLCMSYQNAAPGQWTHDATPGVLQWESYAAGRTIVPALAAYPARMLKRLRTFRPDVLVGASDIPQVVLTAWLARRLGVPYAIDLYDNFEGFGQARIPGFVPALRQAVCGAGLVLTTSEPLRQLVLNSYRAKGTVVSMPSSVDMQVFHPGSKDAARERFGLPPQARLVGTAGGLYRDKGVEPIYRAWPYLASKHPDLHLVLAGPYQPDLPPPQGERVHYLGQLSHAQVADLFCALNVGIISILDTPFGRYCFPQKAYEMLACGLHVAVADIGEMSSLFAANPQPLFKAGDASSLAAAVDRQLSNPSTPDIPVRDWETLVGEVEPLLMSLSRAV